MFDLHRNKVGYILLLLLASLSADGQKFRWARENNPRYDERKISYGFIIGLHSSSYQVKYSDQFVTTDPATQLDTLHSVMAPSSPGFSLGGLVNLRLFDELDLRIMPKAGFYDHKLIYQYTDGQSQDQLIETALMEFPVALKYKSMRRGNIRMYMVGGLTPSFELSGKNDVESNTANLSVKKNDLTIDAGVGLDLYFPLFKFSPELRFSKGLFNVIGSDPSVFKEPLSRLNTSCIQVYLIFQ
jgi:hypothetical protein